MLLDLPSYSYMGILPCSLRSSPTWFLRVSIDVTEFVNEGLATQLQRTLSLSSLAEPLSSDPALKSGIGVRELISTQKKKRKKERKKKRTRGMDRRTFFKNPR